MNEEEFEASVAKSIEYAVAAAKGHKEVIAEARNLRVVSWFSLQI